MREKPLIDKIASHCKKSQRGITISEHLYGLALERRQHLEELKEDYLSKEVPAHPRITRLAAELVREGCVSDRLYDDYMEKVKQRDEAQQLEKDRRSERTKFLPEAEILEHINQMHVDAMENLAEKRERVERLKEEAAQKARPKLSAKSLEIAEQLDETAKQRLLKPRPVVMSPKIDPELTFAPQITAKSQQIPAKSRTPLGTRTFVCTRKP